MHVRWRGLELPARVELDQKSSRSDRSVGSSSSRSSGASAPPSATASGGSCSRASKGRRSPRSRSQGVEHEFSTIPGVLEDVTDIILNVKGLVVSLDGDAAARPCGSRPPVPARSPPTSSRRTPPSRSTTPNHVIATLTDEVDFEAELTVAKGRGYQPASEQYAKRDEQVIGEIPIDAVFSPVQRVRYRVENTRIGQKTNYDKLILDIWTDGTVTPGDGAGRGGQDPPQAPQPVRPVLRAGIRRGCRPRRAPPRAVDEELIRKLNMPIGELAAHRPGEQLPRLGADQHRRGAGRRRTSPSCWPSAASARPRSAR